MNLKSVSDSSELNAVETIKSCQEDIQKMINFLLSLNSLPIILIAWLMIVFLLNGIKTKFLLGIYMRFSLAYGIGNFLLRKTREFRQSMFLTGQRLFVMGFYCLILIWKSLSNIGQTIITINETISIRLYLNVRIESLQSSFLIDTGASRSLVSRKLYERLSKKVTLSKNKLP